MSRQHIPTSLRRLVSERAGYRCGYCRTSQAYSGVQFHIEHIIPLAAGGLTVESNLWLACALCNGYKGSKTQGTDPSTGEVVALFNPRTQKWNEHFTWSEDGLQIMGRSACGRATVVELQLNNEYVLPARRNWVGVGWHPPRE
jgi:hypothetical protein